MDNEQSSFNITDCDLKELKKDILLELHVENANLIKRIRNLENVTFLKEYKQDLNKKTCKELKEICTKRRFFGSVKCKTKKDLIKFILVNISYEKWFDVL